MKKILLLTTVVLIAMTSFAQKSTVSKKKRGLSVELTKEGRLNGGANMLMNDFAKANKLIPEETELGTTVYDAQTNQAIENRFHRYSDGTMGAVWTMGFEDATNFPDRGTAYVYFDGESWSEEPSERIESERCGWSSYAPYGENGEIIVSHTGTELRFSKRENKGSGEWEHFTLEGPEGHDLIWPRLITNGNTIHVVAVTPSEANAGTPYNGMDGALLYSRSTDGGETWVDQNIQLPGTTSDEYTGIVSDEYIWAKNGNTIALVVSSQWYGHDLFMLKTEDDGENWEKTVVWENPYNQVIYDDLVTAPDTLAAPDGTLGADIDSEGNVHITFGLIRALKEETGSGSTFSAFPFYEGIIYWNETMDPFEAENQHYALAFENLVEDETYVGWIPDVDGNGEIDMTLDNLFTYVYSCSTFPTITLDENDNVFLAYATPREDLGDPLKYRHIMGRAKINGTWFGNPNDVEQLDLTNDPLHSFDECIIPQMANMIPGDDKVYIIYQRDNIPGIAYGQEPDHEYVTNYYTLMEADLSDFGIITEIETDAEKMSDEVSQNYPNPFSSSSTVEVRLNQQSKLSLEVMNLVGQTLQYSDLGTVNAGTHKLEIDGSRLETGVYFYNVNINDKTITKKMVVN